MALSMTERTRPLRPADMFLWGHSRQPNCALRPDSRLTLYRDAAVVCEDNLSSDRNIQPMAHGEICHIRRGKLVEDAWERVRPYSHALIVDGEANAFAAD